MIWSFVVAHSFPRSVAKKRGLAKKAFHLDLGYEQWMREGEMRSLIDPPRYGIHHGSVTLPASEGTSVDLVEARAVLM